MSHDVWTRTVQSLGPGFVDRQTGLRLNQQLENLVERVALRLGLKSPGTTHGTRASTHESAATAQALSRSCRVAVDPESGVFTVDFAYRDPAMAQQILSTHLSEFTKDFLQEYTRGRRGKVIRQEKHREAGSSRDSAAVESSPRSGPANKYREEYERASEQLAAYRKKWNLERPEKQREPLYAEIAQARESLRRLVREITRRQEALDTLKNYLVPTAKQTNTLAEADLDGAGREIVSRLGEAVRQHEKISARFVATSRDCRDSKEKVREEVDRLKAYLDANMAALEAKQATMEVDITDKETQLAHLGQRIGELRKRELEAALAKERYLTFLALSPNRNGSLSTRPSPVRAVDHLAPEPEPTIAVKILSPPFIPEHPVFPRKGLYTLVALFLALPLGLLMIVVANFFDHTFDTPEALEEATGYKVLASLKRVEGSSRPSRLRGNRQEPTPATR